MERPVTTEEKVKERTEQIERTILVGGALGYSFEDIAEIIGDPEIESDLTIPQMIEALKCEGSPYRTLYERGKLRGQFAIDRRLQELAAAGDLQALKELDKRKAQIRRDQDNRE